VPVGDDVLALEEAEVFGEFVTEGFVFVGVGEEEFCLYIKLVSLSFRHTFETVVFGMVTLKH
jgi:hypothetical protein